MQNLFSLILQCDVDGSGNFCEEELKLIAEGMKGLEPDFREDVFYCVLKRKREVRARSCGERSDERSYGMIFFARMCRRTELIFAHRSVPRDLNNNSNVVASLLLGSSTAPGNREEHADRDDGSGEEHDERRPSRAGQNHR